MPLARPLSTALVPRAPSLENLDPNVIAELRMWGMVMPRTLELTGMGARYAGKGERGVLE